MNDVHLLFIAMMAYLFTVITCAAGLFYTSYKDNWMQTVGLVLVGFCSGLKLHQVYSRGFVSEETALLAVGTALFALGVTWKVWQYQRYLPPKTYGKKNGPPKTI